MSTHYFRFIPSALTASVALLAIAAQSAELDYVLRGGVAYSDNFERLRTGLERNGSAAVAGVELHGERPEGRLRYDINANLAYFDYQGLNLGSELLGRASLRGTYDFVPESFSWNAVLDYDQIREEVLRPLAPGNRDEQVTASTGPTLRARFSGSMEGQLDARYTRLSYGNRPFDNETIGGRAQLVRRANPRSLLAVGVSYDEVTYVSSLGPSGLDYDRQEVFARIGLDGVRTEVSLEAGYADVSGSLVNDGGPVLRARLNRRLSPMLTGALSYIREYPTSESSALTSAPSVSGGVVLDNSLLTSAPRLSSGIEAGLRLDRPRTQAEINYTRREEESLVVGLGRRSYDEIRARVSRDFTRSTRGSVFGATSNEDFTAFARSIDEWNIGAELTLAFGRALGLDLRIQYNERNGTALLDQYSELSGGLFLRYAGSLGRSESR
jgi:hypothetical protein